MSASRTLPAVAIANGWDIETTEPDFFGDTRVRGTSAAGRMTMVFDNTGSLAGGYLFPAGSTGRWWYTTRVRDMTSWLQSSPQPMRRPA